MKSKAIALSSLFGIVISTQKVFLPPPYDKVISIFLQLVFLSLSFLMVGFIGPILTGFISGLVTATVRFELGFMTFTFALIYGILVSALNRSLKVLNSGRIIKLRWIISSLASTVFIGILSLGASIALGLIPYNPVLITVIMSAGAIQGLFGGIFSFLIWERYLHSMRFA